MADETQDPKNVDKKNVPAVTPKAMVSAMRGHNQINTAGDVTPTEEQLISLMSEMRTQADSLGYDISGKVTATIEGEKTQLTWSFNRLQKGAK